MRKKQKLDGVIIQVCNSCGKRKSYRDLWLWDIVDNKPFRVCRDCLHKKKEAFDAEKAKQV